MRRVVKLSRREHLTAVRGQLSGLAALAGVPKPEYVTRIPEQRAPRQPSGKRVEADVNDDIREWQYSNPRVTLYRNNRGEVELSNGGRIRYGVGPTGASDWLGWTIVTITPDMVGSKVAVFTAVEAKAPGKFVQPGDNQDKFILRVRAAGGLAGDARSVEDARRITKA